MSPKPSDSFSGMLLTVVDEYGGFEELFCEHELLSRYKGKLRPLAKFVTMDMKRKLQEACPPAFGTKYHKVPGEMEYRYQKEPEKGDFHRFEKLDSGKIAELFDEEFQLDEPKDGRWYMCALLYDFVFKYGRKARTGDTPSSYAYIKVKSFI